MTTVLCRSNSTVLVIIVLPSPGNRSSSLPDNSNCKSLSTGLRQRVTASNAQVVLLVQTSPCQSPPFTSKQGTRAYLASMTRESNHRAVAIASAVGGILAGACLTHAYYKRKAEKDVAGETRSPPRKSLIFEDPTKNESSSNLNVLFPHNHEEKMRRQIAARAAVEEENVMPRRSVTVRVPATSANMGPGCKSSGGR
jgi:hypothetical protein